MSFDDALYFPVNFLNSLKKGINTVVGAILFAIENYRKRYQYVLIGEKHDSASKETILLYRIIGKRHIFEMSAKEICNIKGMMARFHPLDVRIIAFIAGVEQTLEIPQEKRIDKFHKLKKEIFTADS